MCRFGMFIKILFEIRFENVESICFFLTFGKSGSVLEKSNMLVLTKEATYKDRSLKTQLFLSTNISDKKISGETV